MTISQTMLHHGSDYTPYEGIEVTGWPVSTMVRGKFVVRDGKLVGAKGDGAYVSRAKSPLAAPSGAIARRHYAEHEEAELSAGIAKSTFWFSAPAWAG